MLTQALVGASVVPKAGGRIDGKSLEQLAIGYLSREAIVTRLSKTIDEQALAAFKRGVKVDLSSAQSAGASALRLKEAMAVNGNGVSVRARYDEKHEQHQLVLLVVASSNAHPVAVYRHRFLEAERARPR